MLQLQDKKHEARAFCELWAYADRMTSGKAP